MEIGMYMLTILMYLLYAVIFTIAFALFLILIILFVPIVYSVDASKYDDIHVVVKAKWLMSILKVSYEQNGNKSKTTITIMGIKLKGKKEKPLKEKPLKENKKQDKKTEKIVESKDYEPKIKDEDIEKDIEKNIKNSYKETKKSKISWKDKYDNIILKIQPYLEKINIFMEYENKKEIMKLTMKLLTKLYKALNLKIYDLKAEIGFEERDKTGKALGIIGLITGLFAIDIDVKGNFEQEIMNFSGKVKGKIRIFSILLPILVFVSKKPVWKIIKTII